MKITRKSNIKQRLIVILPLIIILGLIGAYGYHQWKLQNKSSAENTKVNKVNYNPPTSEQEQSGQNVKNSTVDNSSNGKPVAPGTDTSQPPSNNNTISVTITAANQNGSTFSVRSLIGAVTNSGTCTITFTKDSTVVTKTSDIQALANSSTCRGFDIPTSELTAGQWHMQLNVAADNKTGSASKDITIQ